MVKSVYVGRACIVKDIGSPEYKAVFLALKFDEEDGSPNFIDGWTGKVE
jgi:hypothetical protein